MKLIFSPLDSHYVTQDTEGLPLTVFNRLTALKRSEAALEKQREALVLRRKELEVICALHLKVAIPEKFL